MIDNLSQQEALGIQNRIIQWLQQQARQFCNKHNAGLKVDYYYDVPRVETLSASGAFEDVSADGLLKVLDSMNKVGLIKFKPQRSSRPFTERRLLLNERFLPRDPYIIREAQWLENN